MYIEVTLHDYVPYKEKLQNFSAQLFKCVLMKLDVGFPPEIVIYVHNFNKDSTDTKEEFIRIQTSLNDTNYKTPLIELS